MLATSTASSWTAPCQATRDKLTPYLGKTIELHGVLGVGKISDYVLVDGCEIYILGQGTPDTTQFSEGAKIFVRGILHFSPARSAPHKKGWAEASIFAFYSVSPAQVTVEP